MRSDEFGRQAFGGLEKGILEHRPAVASVVVPEGLFVQVGLQVLGAGGVVDAIDPRV